MRFFLFQNTYIHIYTCFLCLCQEIFPFWGIFRHFPYVITFFRSLHGQLRTMPWILHLHPLKTFPLHRDRILLSALFRKVLHIPMHHPPTHNIKHWKPEDTILGKFWHDYKAFADSSYPHLKMKKPLLTLDHTASRNIPIINPSTIKYISPTPYIIHIYIIRIYISL